ncbi:hypothetical protein ABE504_10020 [Paenibacillus oryzisoli]|uniref:hypothetical protein n=1 Tax=Paenibacillus oryzisoli TaxID=1850517 RepID=UPI003D27B61C
MLFIFRNMSLDKGHCLFHAALGIERERPVTMPAKRQELSFSALRFDEMPAITQAFWEKSLFWCKSRPENCPFAGILLCTPFFREIPAKSQALASLARQTLL